MGFTTGGPSETVILAVADATNRDALSLPPLAASIDPDVLEGIVDRTGNGSVRFTYAGTEVRVTHDGEITVDGASPAQGSTRQTVPGGLGD
jgi:hypothetical protein